MASADVASVWAEAAAAQETDKENVSTAQVGTGKAGGAATAIARGTAGHGQDAATQTPVKMGKTPMVLSMGKESWKDWDVKGRATFRPPASEVGRPVFHPDAEEAEVLLRRLKRDVRKAEEERDLAKAHLVRAEKEIKRRDHRIFKELEEHEHAAVLPERLRVLVKNSLKSGQAEEVRMLREKLAALEASADRLRTANLLGDGAAHIGGAAASAPGTPSAKQGGGRFDEEAPASPVRRQLSASRGAGSARNLAEGAGSSKGAEALMAARAEVDRLQKLCAAHDVIREGLEKRVAQLEAQLSRHAGAAPPDSGAAGPAAAGAAAKPGGFGEGEHDSKEGGASLFTEEGRGFDNYIRRLAGLSELPSPAAGGDPGSLRVSTDVKSKRRPAVQLTSAKADREVVYEVTCHTGDVAGAGTSSNCYITLRGEGGEFGPCALDRSDAHSAKPGLGVLAQNATDVFDIVALNVEPLHSIIISHDMSGPAPSWHLRTISLRRHRTATSEAKSYRFEWNNWVGAPQGTPASSPASVTIFPEMINREPHTAEGSSSSHLARHQAPGGGKGQQGRGGEGGAARGPDAINKTALSEACQSMVTAIRELHLPSAVSQTSGLERLARLLGAGTGGAAGGSSKMEMPSSCRNLSIMLLGPRQLCSEVVEWYGGCKMADTGLSTKTRFTYVKALPPQQAGAAAAYLLGEECKGELGHMGNLAEQPSLLGSLAVAKVASFSPRMAQVDILHPPVVEGSPPSTGHTSILQEAMNDIRDALHNQADSLFAIFKDIDKDGSGEIDVKEWTAALQKLGLDMPATRAERIFKALDVSGDGEIEYGEFLAAFKPTMTTYPYDLEAAAEAAAASADLVIILVDPKTIHYNLRELGLITRLNASCPGKLRLACYIRENIRDDSKLASHLVPAARRRLEQVMGLSSNALQGHLPNLWVPAHDGAPKTAVMVDNQIDEVLVWVKDALLGLENLAVDQTEHNTRLVLDALWSAGDSKASSQARGQLSAWLQAWRDATARRKTPSFTRLHAVLDKALKDVKRGNVVEDDVEGWPPKRVAAWLTACNPAFGKYASSFIDEQVTGKRLVRLTEDVLKRKLHVDSLGHRKEMVRHLDALLRGRKAYLKTS